MADKNINVTLTADVDAYVDGMERATAATAGLGDVLRSLGITAEDMPAAIKGVLALVRDTKAS